MNTHLGRQSTVTQALELEFWNSERREPAVWSTGLAKRSSRRSRSSREAVVPGRGPLGAAGPIYFVFKYSISAFFSAGCSVVPYI
jgi:hypothetical protein